MSETKIIHTDIQTSAKSHDSEQVSREHAARQLVGMFIGRHGDYFATPENRLDFIQSQQPEDFLGMAQYINAKLRGEKPHELRHQPRDQGGALPILHTPATSDKPIAFTKGFEAIHDYIETSNDSTDKKVEGAALAAEALMIWVHPFDDGNGRTGRFLGCLIEEGGSDVEKISKEASSGAYRPRAFYHVYTSRQSALMDADNQDLLIDDDERDDLRERAKTMPNDIDAIYMGIQLLLYNEEVREKAYLKNQSYRLRS